jgi:hypothetical protein
MLAAPATGPSHMPASTTSIGCNVIGTGVNGSGIATCDAAATAAAKPTIPTIVSDGESACPEGVRDRDAVDAVVVMSVHP